MVRNLYNKDKAKYTKVFKKINNISKRFCENKYTDISELINENGLILEDLGIVNKKAIDFSREVRKKGGAIKVAGAGGLSESGSGILLCKLTDNVVLDSLLKQYNYSKILTELGVEGVN